MFDALPDAVRRWLARIRSDACPFDRGNLGRAMRDVAMNDQSPASLASLGAPADLLRWAETIPSRDAALASSTRPDWLVWIAPSGARSKDDQQSVLRAARATITVGHRGARWRQLLFRSRPDLCDDVGLQCGDADLNDTDHQIADIVTSLCIALLLWAPLDVYLFIHPIGSLAGVRREVVTLPLLAAIAFVIRRLWSRVRLRAARPNGSIAFETLWERLAPRMAASDSIARRSAQLLGARRALGLGDPAGT